MSSNNSTHFLKYLGASSLWLAGMTLSSFVSSWLLVDQIEASPEQTGWAFTLSRLIPLALLLLGGMLVDRSNNRNYLVAMHALIGLPALVLVALAEMQQLTYVVVVIFMVSMSALQALSDPARQAVLSRIAPTDIQRSVTLVALASSAVSFLAITLGGGMDRIGEAWVLIIMAMLFVSSLWPILRLPSLPSLSTPPMNEPQPASTWHALLSGARAVWQSALLRTVIICNFASSMFNAGAYTVAIPFIAKETYQGDSQTFAWALGAITLGAGVSSALLLLVMPFKRPGRVFLAFQLTRALILLALWANFGEWAFYVLMALWGVNMGVTSTLARSIVQEQSPDAERGRVFSLMLLSFMLASAIGAPVLGAVVGAGNPLSALLPGVAISILIFAGGRLSTLWSYKFTNSSRPAKISH